MSQYATQKLRDLGPEIFLLQNGIDSLLVNLLNELFLALGSPRGIHIQHFIEYDSN